MTLREFSKTYLSIIMELQFLTFFVLSVVFPVFLFLDLNDSDSVILSFGSSL